jgi:uncharacterized membrane protein HdeD (DUF308 family)
MDKNQVNNTTQEPKYIEDNKLDIIGFSTFAGLSAISAIAGFVSNSKHPDKTVLLLALMCSFSVILSSYQAVKAAQRYKKQQKTK